MRRILWVGNVLCLSQKFFKNKEEAEKYLFDREHLEWKNWISDEEYERRFHRKKFQESKITGEKFVRFKKVLEEPNCDGEVWFGTLIQAYFTEKGGRGAVKVWTTNATEYQDIDAFHYYWEECGKYKNQEEVEE